MAVWGEMPNHKLQSWYRQAYIELRLPQGLDPKLRYDNPVIRHCGHVLMQTGRVLRERGLNPVEIIESIQFPAKDITPEDYIHPHQKAAVIVVETAVETVPLPHEPQELPEAA